MKIYLINENMNVVRTNYKEEEKMFPRRQYKNGDLKLT